MALPKPPSCSQCTTTTQPATPGVAPTQQASQILKAHDGKMRVDFPNTSVITNPVAQHALFLDHAKQEMKIIPMPPPLPNAPKMPGMPSMPALPAMPNAPHPPAMSVKDLGKAMIAGHPVEGKEFTMHLPTLPGVPKTPDLKPPKLPKMPKLPGLPKVAGMKLPDAPKPPDLPKPPAAPAPPAPPKPPIPTVAQVWSSTVTGMPVLSKITGEFGQQIMSCQTAPVPEPHPSMFEPPPGYKLVP